MNYQEATFYFYTGTGNSYRVAAWMADAARQTGATVTLRPIESAHPSAEIGEGEVALLGLVTPTHAFTAPWATLRFALCLPRRAKTHAAVIAARGGTKIGPLFIPGLEGTAAYLIALVLALKGYHVRGAMGVDMPVNWIAVHPGLSPETAREITARARARVARFTDTILSGRPRFSGWIALFFGLGLLPTSLAYLLVGRFFLARLFFASDRCTSCGLCAEHCPNSAIRMRNSGKHRRPYWTFHCESCMRCMAFCPTQAVEANYLLGIGTYVLAAAIPTTPFLTWIPGWVLESVYSIVVIGLAYPLLHPLLRIRWINCLFTLATLTHYYRRYHEPETMLKDLQ